MSAVPDSIPLGMSDTSGKIRVGFGNSAGNSAVVNRKFDSHAQFLDALADPSLAVHVTGTDPASGKKLKDGPYIVAPMRHGKRSKENAEPAYHVCLDIDDGDPNLTNGRLQDALTSIGYMCAFWETTNSDPEVRRWRVVHCVDTPIDPDKFKKVHFVLESRVRAALGMSSGAADMTAGRPSQPQFLCPVGRTVYRLTEGCKLVPVAEMLAAHVSTPSTDPALAIVAHKVPGPTHKDPVIAAFAERNWLGAKLGPGQWTVECPWKGAHTTPSPPDGSDTVIFEPNHGGFSGYGFRCLHAHCDKRRFDPDVVKELGLAQSLAPLFDTDIANARRFIAQHGDDVRFTSEQNWLVWQKWGWAPDRTGEMMARAKSVAESILAEVAAEFGESRKDLLKWARRSQSADRLRAMLALAQSEPGIPVPLASFDADPMLLNCPNGTLDLATGKLRVHRRDDLITKATAAEFHWEASADLWDGFLWKALGGDQALYDYVQRAVGYSLTGRVDEQVFFFCYGLGANGKSVFLETVGGILGDYGTTARTEMVMARSGSGIPNDIAALRGQRFVAVNETADGQRFNEPLIKDLVGGDTVSARFLFREFFTYQPQFKLWLRGNHKPAVYGTDHGIWRRIHLVPFTVTIPPAERDPDLLQKLRLERSGILRWAVEGCRMWQKDGLNPPPRVLEAVEDYRAEMDAIGQFLAERTELDSASSLKAGDLYASYRDWAEAGGEFQLSLRRFGTAIRERGFQKYRNEQGVHYRGLRLRKSGLW